MSIDLFDDSDNKPIDLFAMTPSQEGYAFPIEQFTPGAPVNSVKEHPDEPASYDTKTETNVEVNPNNPEETLVDVLETGMIPDEVSLGLESDGITDTPLDPLPPPIEPAEHVSLEQDLRQLSSLNDSLINLKDNGGISRDDVLRIEQEHPGLITKRHPMGGFSSVVSLCGYEVSCESLTDKIIDMVDAILSAIGRLIDKLLNAESVSMPSMGNFTVGSDKSLKVRWNNLNEVAQRLDGLKGANNLAERIPGSAAARKSSTFKHFVRLYPIEIITSRVADVPAGYTLVLNGVTKTDLLDIDRNLGIILNQVRTALSAGTSVEFPTIEVGEFRARYAKRVKGLVPPIERLVEIETPTDVIKNIRDHVRTLNELKREVAKQKNTMVGNTTLSTTLKSVAGAIRVADAYSSRLEVCLDAYRRYNGIVGAGLDQTSVKLQMFKAL